VGGHLTLVAPFVTLVGELDVEAPVIWVLVVEGIARVTRVSVKTVRDEMQLVVLTAGPGYLQRQNALQVYLVIIFFFFLLF
jgi:hypothetical protein